MTLKARLTKLENTTCPDTKPPEDSWEQLFQYFENLAERLRNTPLSEIGDNAAPVTYAALFLDGRADEHITNKCHNFAERDDNVGQLFRFILALEEKLDLFFEENAHAD
ncbi:MAG: hypothetical protein AAFZ99_06585 [Pseudomonadota bacterium]